MSGDIEVLAAEVDRLKDELDDARKRLKAARDATVPFKVGDRVLAQRYGQSNAPWREAELARIEHHGYGGPSYYVRWFRKDGSPSVASPMYVGGELRPVES